MLFVWIIVAIVVLAAIYVLITYNGLVSMRNRIENAWAQIDVQLKRRYDLIPNLVETVKGYASHERGTLEAVVQARNMAMNAAGPAGPGRRREHDHRRAEERVRAVRGLPRPQGEPELPQPAGGAHRHRGPDRLRAAVLQRHRFQATTPRSSRCPRTSWPTSSASPSGSTSRSTTRPAATSRWTSARPRPSISATATARLRRPPPRRPSDPPRTLTPACTTRSLRTSADPSSCCSPSSASCWRSASAFNLVVGGGPVLHALRARLRGRDGGRVVLEVRRDRAARQPGSTSVRRGVRPAAQHRGGPLHRRWAAQAPPVHRRRPVAERLRDRARSEARRGGRHHGAAREDEPGRARGRARPRAEPHQELRHPRLHARRDDGGRHRHRRRHRRALHVVRHGAEPQQRQRQRRRRASARSSRCSGSRCSSSRR